MKTRVYYNTSNSPVIIDGEGHTIGGGEFFAAERNDQIRKAIDLGQLVETEADEELAGHNSEAGKAHKSALEANSESDAQKPEKAAKSDKEGTKEVPSDSASNESTSRKSGK